jgi:pyruvate,water dikinase
VSLDDIPETKTNVMLNVADPGSTTRWWRLPAAGVGLARMEFLVSNVIRAHPLALLNYDSLPEDETKEAIAELTKGFENKADYFVDTLARGIGRIAAVWYPNPVIVRLSRLQVQRICRASGRRGFEPKEENPMIGLRGASRYYSDFYRDAFALECVALKYLREKMGFDNVTVMVPFCRSIEEADKVIDVMAEHGLRRGENGLKLYVMTEIPSNVIRAEEFAERFDGFSIGSNDLTQLTLGVDRDSGELSDVFQERDPAVLWMIEQAIAKAHATGSKIGLCGQAPSNDPEFAKLLVKAGIHSISVTPDSFLARRHRDFDQAAIPLSTARSGLAARTDGGDARTFAATPHPGPHRGDVRQPAAGSPRRHCRDRQRHGRRVRIAADPRHLRRGPCRSSGQSRSALCAAQDGRGGSHRGFRQNIHLARRTGRLRA